MNPFVMFFIVFGAVLFVSFLVITYIQDDEFKRIVDCINPFIKKSKVIAKIVKFEDVETVDSLNSIHLLDRFHKNYDSLKMIKDKVIYFETDNKSKVFVVSKRYSSKLELEQEGVLTFSKNKFLGFKTPLQK